MRSRGRGQSKIQQEGISRQSKMTGGFLNLKNILNNSAVYC